VLGLALDKFGITLDDFTAGLPIRLKEKKPYTYASLNLHALSFFQKDPEFREALNEADKIRFDGIAAIWLARLSGSGKVEKIGSDVLMDSLYEHGSRRRWGFFLLGGPRGAAKSAADKINEVYPDLQILGTHHGYFNRSEEDRIIARINSLSPDILIVGMGMPKQEKWIRRNRNKLKVGLITSCGAYIEQISEKGLGYFPKWANRFHLSWLLRVIKNPNKIAGRYIADAAAFFPLLAKAVFNRFANLSNLDSKR